MPEEGEPISAGDLFKAAGDLSKNPTGIAGLDYVFDGGLPRLGGTILTAAPHGSGKSSLLVTLAQAKSNTGDEVLFLSTEQALSSLAQQFHRFGQFSSTHMFFLYQKDRDEIMTALDKTTAKIAIVDSIHRVENVTDDDGFPLSSGHAAAVTHVAVEIKRLADQKQMVVFAVAHMTNSAEVMGGTGARHMCDATLAVNFYSDANDPRRIIQFKGKNRFGPVGRRALFEMTSRGFEDRGPLLEDPQASQTTEFTSRIKNRLVN